MATPYPGNVTPLAQPTPDTAAGPIIRTIGLSDLRQAGTAWQQGSEGLRL